MDSIEVVMPRYLRHGYIFTWYQYRIIKKAQNLAGLQRTVKWEKRVYILHLHVYKKKKRVNDIFIIAITTAIF